MIKLGLALGSGGARGLAHVGVLAVLEEAGLRPDFIAGTSMGAIVGALYASTVNAELLAEKLGEYTDDPEFKASWAPFIEDDELEGGAGFLKELRRNLQRRILTFKTFTSPSQRKAEALLEPLSRLFSDRNIENMAIPFAAVAVDLISGEPRIFRQGDIFRAIYASSAIPGVFPPLEDGEAMLSDGGGPYRVPVGICREMGADFVLAVDIPSFQPEKENLKTGLDMLMRSDVVARHRLNQMILREADFVVRPDVEDFHWANFGAGERIRESGKQAMREALPELRRLMAAKNSGLGRLRRGLGRLMGDRRGRSRTV